MIPKVEDCKPGRRASGFNVLIVMEPVSEKTSGGVFLPGSAVQKEQMVSVNGRILSKGPASFDYADFGDAEPQVGDAVIIGKLAGVIVTGRDGHTYRMVDDKSVIGLIDEQEEDHGISAAA